MHSVDAFIFNSQTSKESVENLLGTNKPEVIAHPAGDRLNPQISSSEIETRASSSGPLRVVFVGNLIRRKAPHLLVEAMSLLEPDTIHLSIAGSLDVEAAYVRQLRSLVARQNLNEHVRFLGHMDEEGLATLLQSSQVMVVPSSYEGYGIVYLEGMGFALPAIGTRAGAAGEIITDKKDGYLVEAGHVAQLAARLSELQRNRTRLLAMSYAALERYRRHPTWQQSMARAANFLEAYIINGRP